MNNKKIFFNQTFDKTRLKVLILWYLTQYGDDKTINFIENLKNIGFFYATQAGLSLSIEDLQIPPSKSHLIVETERLIGIADLENQTSKKTPIEYFQNIIDLWYKTSELIRYNVIQNFNKTDKLNPVFMMAFSGARGNISQVRQLVGMRGLMADPEGQILNFPIRSNFREGLSLTEYIISCYGARKGLVDTALKTANSGYLTRRLVDVAQHIIISQYNCQTKQGIYIGPSIKNNEILISLEKKLIGRVLGENIPKVAKKNQIITPDIAILLNKIRQKIFVRSPLSCNLKNSICQLCYGWNLSTNKLVSLGECVGIIAAQSIGEPGTQLTMRTFHTGGVFSGDVMEEIRSPHSGTIHFQQIILGNLIRTLDGSIAFLTRKESNFIIRNKVIKNNTTYKIPKATILFVKNNQKVKENQLLGEYSFVLNIKNNEIQTKYEMISKHEGEIYFENIFSLQNKISNNFKIGLNFGTFWVLYGKIYQSALQSSFFIHSGDIIDTKSILIQLDKIIPYNSQLTIKKKNRKTFLYAKQKKNIKSKKFLIYQFFGNFTMKNYLYKKIAYTFTLKNLELAFVIPNPIQKKKSIRSFYIKALLKKNKNNFLLFSKKNYFKESIYFTKKKIILLKKNKNSMFFMKNIIFIKKKIDFINTKSNKKIVQLYFIKNFFYRKLIFNKISFILKKNPYTKFSKKKYNISLIYFKDSKKIRKNILPIKEQNLNNNNYKITIYTGWSLISNLYFFYSHSNNELFLKKRKVEKFFYSKNVSSEILFLFFNFYYFNIFKFLKNRKFIKNNKFFLTLDNTIISRNRLIKTNLKKGNTIINNYKKIHEKRLNCKLKRKNIFKILFDKKKYYKNFNILNSFQNQQQKYKIKTNFVFFSIEKNNLINFNNLKIISHIFILKFNANNYFQNNQIDIIYKFPQQISFYKKKRIREKNFLHIKKNLKIRKKKILENSIFYRYSICSPVYGEITKIQNSFLGKQKTIFLSKNEKKTYISENLSKNFFMGKVIRIGDPLNSLYVSKVNGQIIQKTKKYITIRKAHPYLFSTQSIFHMKNTDFVKKNNLLMTLFYQKLKNEDIIQGIPKIEELFEARNLKTLEKKKDNIHLKLELCFQKYKKLYSLEKALQKSIKTIQQVLVHNIQKVYQEQGVFIADKHVEIIVRQMTTKIFITESGKSGLLQGELIDIKYIELINLGNNFKQIHYQPIILGITKASLETESFISAASFQETTRILSNGVIEQKTDFLRGLKENVIVGHLIPAGTGYKVFSL